MLHRNHKRAGSAEFTLKEFQLSNSRIGARILEEAESCAKAQEGLTDFEELIAKMCLRGMTRKEKMTEARKPLYLKRYE